MVIAEHSRRADRCWGWHCLTPAEQFGVIFSIVVVAIVLLIAWLFLLGKKAMAHRNHNKLNLPGGREAPRNHNLPENVALGQLPIAQQWPGQPPQVYYQPVVHSRDPHGQYHAQPYYMTGPYTTQRGPVAGYQPAAVPIHPPLLCSPATMVPPHVAQPQQPLYNPSSTVSRVLEPTSTHQENHSWKTIPGDRASGNRSTVRHTNVFQKLASLLRMPTGRASTIVSSDGGETPRRSYSSRRSRVDTPERGDGESRQATRAARHDEEGRAPELRPQTPPSPSGTATDSSISVPTNVATVHSDDYDVIRVSSEQSTPPYRDQARGKTIVREYSLDLIDEISSNSSVDQGNERIGTTVATVSIPEQRLTFHETAQSKETQPMNGSPSKQKSTKSPSKIPRFVPTQGYMMNNGRESFIGPRHRDSARAGAA